MWGGDGVSPSRNLCYESSEHGRSAITFGLRILGMELVKVCRGFFISGILYLGGMAKVRITRYGPTDNPGGIYGVGFICPGCGQDHTCPTEKYHAEGYHELWGFNGDFYLPTFTPSLLWRSGHFAHPVVVTSPYCWCKPAEGVEAKPEWCYRCHSLVKDGLIEFLSDCSHALAGQTVALPEIEPFGISE